MKIPKDIIDNMIDAFGVDSFLEYANTYEESLIDVLRFLIEAKKYREADMLAFGCMTYLEQLAYLIFKARMSLSDFKKEFPGCDTAERLIATTEKFIHFPSPENEKEAISHTDGHSLVDALCAVITSSKNEEALIEKALRYAVCVLEKRT